MKQSFKKILLAVAVLLLVWLIANASLVIYGFRQLKGQLELVWNAVPVDEYIKTHPDSSEINRKLLYLNEVREFAMHSLQLHASANYTTFYDHGNKPVMWVVTGCHPYAFEAKEWEFPFLGSLSYKGFFCEDLATEEAARVNREGFETDIYNPSAWSTLGFLKDPILSGMLRKGPGQLAELIIHELTHATIYLPGQVEYNENLATFIGEQGALMFLSSHFGEQSREKLRYEKMLHDQDVYARHMLHGAERLDSLYATFSGNENTSRKARMKYALIAEILLGINHLPLKEPELYRFDFRKDPLPGNTFFMSYRRYRKDQSEMYRQLHEMYRGDLKAMIAGLTKQ